MDKQYEHQLLNKIHQLEQVVHDMSERLKELEQKEQDRMLIKNKKSLNAQKAISDLQQQKAISKQKYNDLMKKVSGNNIKKPVSPKVKITLDPPEEKEEPTVKPLPSKPLAEDVNF